MFRNKKFIFANVVVLFVVIAAYLLYHWSNSSRELKQVTIIHPFSYSNAAIFQASIDDPSFWKRKPVADTSKHADILRAEGGQAPTIAVTPFTNALIAASKDSSIRIIGGAGLNGLYIVSKGGSSVGSLRDKTIGTARADSLELLLEEAMGDIQFKRSYFDDPFVAIEALEKGDIDAVTHVEPFVTNMINNGMVRLLSSRDLWGDHPDAILVTTVETLRKFPREMEMALRKLKTAESKVNSDPSIAASKLAPLYAPVTAEQLVAILPKQQARVDIRGFMPFFEKRFDTLKRLKYLSEDESFPEQSFDFELLEKVLNQ